MMTLFLWALFHNNLLDNTDIYNIANLLTNKINDDDLVNIIVNGIDDNNNKKLFENYLNKLKLNYFLHPKKALIAKVFHYILLNRIGGYSCQFSPRVLVTCGQ